jgi:hypothetical protein
MNTPTGHNYIMLTGAGFTANFGTPLESGFINWILPAIKDDTQLSKIFNKHSNFEAAYTEIMNREFSDVQKKLVHEALVKQFKEMNSAYKKAFIESFQQFPYNY